MGMVGPPLRHEILSYITDLKCHGVPISADECQYFIRYQCLVSHRGSMTSYSRVTLDAADSLPMTEELGDELDDATR